MAGARYNIQTFITLGLTLLVCYFAYLWQIGAMPVMMWDEGLQLVSGIEMLDNDNYLVTHYNGKPDMWNTKPPLFIWLVTLSYKLFGVSAEVGRVPAALSGIVLCLFLFWYFAKNKQPWLGFLAVLVLSCSPGYVGIHVTRTADFDGVLILFVFLYSWHLFRYINEQKTKNIVYAALFFICAVLTKGVAAVLITPAIFLYALTQKKLLPLLKNKWTYIGAALALAGSIGFYLLRESANPGYLNAIVNNELGGRFNQSLEGHEGPWYYFFENYWKESRYIVGSILFVVFAPVSVLYKGPYRKFSLYTLLIALFYLLVVSIAKTKIQHYDAQAYPFMAINIAVGIYYSIIYLKEKQLWGKLILSPVIIGLVFMVYFGYQNLNTLFTQNYNDVLYFGKMFDMLEKHHPGIKNVTIYYAYNNTSQFFYDQMYSRRGFAILRKRVSPDQFNNPEIYTFGEVIISCDSRMTRYLIGECHYTPIASFGQCVVVRVGD